MCNLQINAIRAEQRKLQQQTVRVNYHYWNFYR